MGISPHSRHLFHQRRTLIYLLTVLILIGGLVGGLIALNLSQDIRSKAGNNGAKLSLSPATKTQTVGETFSLVITMNPNANAVSAAELHISYDPSAIQIISFTPGTPLPVILVPETHINGEIAVTLAAKPPTPIEKASIVGVLTAKVIAVKQSTISFTNATQVSALGKDTNVLAFKTDTTITGVAAVIPTSKPPQRKF